MKAWAALLGALPLAAVMALGGTLINLPMASDDHLAQYAAAAAELPVRVPWEALVAVDAVRYRQDFSQVTRVRIRETAALFLACRNDVTRTSLEWRLDRVGESVRHQLVVPVPSIIRWNLRTESGTVVAELLDSLDKTVTTEVVDKGVYVLLIYATGVPAVYHLEYEVEAQEAVCYGRPMDEVMDDLGFATQDRELARNMLRAFDTRQTGVEADTGGHSPGLYR